MKNWTGENERKRLMPQERTGFEVILFIFFIIWEVRRDLGRLITQIAACFGHKSFFFNVFRFLAACYNETLDLDIENHHRHKLIPTHELPCFFQERCLCKTQQHPSSLRFVIAKNCQVLETFKKKYPNDPINLEDFGED